MGLYSFLNYKVLLGLCYSTSPQASCQIYMYMFSIMSIMSQLHDRVWLHVCCLTLDIDIPVIALLICLYKHRQTITLHAFSMFICLHIPDHDNYFVCSINYTLSEWWYFMPEIKSFGALSELKCISLLKTSLEKSSLKFRHGFNFVVFIHPRK